ncbi:MAG: VWA domain-containing protein [Eubacterium sp.]|nr:VWA domain-containing protein [Eubacterium sp.]
MYCRECGANIPEEAFFCPQCGADLPKITGQKDPGGTAGETRRQESSGNYAEQNGRKSVQNDDYGSDDGSYYDQGRRGGRRQDYDDRQDFRERDNEGGHTSSGGQKPSRNYKPLIIGLIAAIAVLLGVIAAMASGIFDKREKIDTSTASVESSADAAGGSSFGKQKDAADGEAVSSSSAKYSTVSGESAEASRNSGTSVSSGDAAANASSGNAAAGTSGAAASSDAGADAASAGTSSDSGQRKSIGADTTVTDQPDAGSSSGGSAAQPAATGYDAIANAISSKVSGILDFVSSDVTEYPTVKLYYSYTDSAGEPITLTSPTAGIRESISGGAEIERTIRRVERLEGNQGLSIDLVADKSASMSGDLGQMQMIMQQFVQSMDFASGDQAEIISFDSYIMYMCTYTQDVSLLQNGISNMTAYGDTALYDALVTGINNAGSQAGARCVIGFTDGEDNMSIYTPDEVISLALQKEVPVYIIGTGMADYATLSDIALSTGGDYWSVDSISDLSQIMMEIYSNQKDLYCIEYDSEKSADPYASRTVSCVLADETHGGMETGVSFQATEALSQVTHASRYEIIQGDLSWTEANDICISKGGHLATITSQSEMDQLVSMAEKSGLKYLWIGGYTSVRNNSTFGHWITGEDFNYTAWYPGEPSRNDLDGTPEFYLMMWKVGDAWSWNDQRNDVANSEFEYFKGNVGYICEYEQ